MSPVPFKAFSKYIGVPYVDHGRAMSGWDCYGLYVWVYRELYGLVLPDYSELYESAERLPDVAAAIARQTPQWQRVALGSERQGDGVVFNLYGQPAHCGFVIERGTMLHAMKGRDTVIEPYTGPGWKKRIEGAYRWN